MSLICELRQIASLDDLYAQMAEQLAFPAHFGRNLDALYDTLANDVPGPITLIWHQHEPSRHALGASYDQLVAILEDVSTERGDLTIEWL